MLALFWGKMTYPLEVRSINTKKGGVAFRHRERGLKNFCNKLLSWDSGPHEKQSPTLFAASYRHPLA